MTSVNGDSAILQKIDKMEQAVAQGLKQLDEKLALGLGAFRLIDDGLAAYRTRLLKSSGVSRQSQLVARIAERVHSDRELGFPHRKILDILLGHYDFSNENFTELNFSRLVREAHVGKNAAKGYLRILEEKGLVESRTDGYRKFFRIREQVQQ
ncbi:MAG: helix-turn-helix transcriptional regulator [Acidobacteria bacterium]|nr:helix-turn-helix transcriptional regulator [Acidobacteriota bacterium]